MGCLRYLLRRDLGHYRLVWGTSTGRLHEPERRSMAQPQFSTHLYYIINFNRTGWAWSHSCQVRNAGVSQ